MITGILACLAEEQSAHCIVAICDERRLTWSSDLYPSNGHEKYVEGTRSLGTMNQRCLHIRCS